MGIAFIWAFILGGGILLFSDTPRYRKLYIYVAHAGHATVHHPKTPCRTDVHF